MELSQKLKELRKKQGLTQLELAERLFVSRQAISGWEAGTSRPSTENLQSLSRLFNIPLETLLDDTAEAEPAAAPEKLPAEEQAKEDGKGQGLGKDRRYKAIVMVSHGDCALGNLAHHSGIGTQENGPRKNGCHDF